MYNPKKVAIIGAGLAGLTAGYYLKKQGFHFDVFESKDYIGGRTQTVQFGDGVHAELGGQEITDGGEASAIQALANELGCPLSAQEYRYEVRALDEERKLVSLFDIVTDPSPRIDRSVAYPCLSDRLDHIYGVDTQARKLVENWIACYEGLNSIHIPDDHGLGILQWITERIGIARTPNTLRQSLTFTNGTSDFARYLQNHFQDEIQLSRAVQKIQPEGEHVYVGFSNHVQKKYDKVILATPLETLGMYNLNNQRMNLISQSLQGGKNTKILIPVEINQEVSKFALTPEFTLWWDHNRNVLTVYFGGHQSDAFQGTELNKKEIWKKVSELYPEIKNKSTNLANWVVKEWVKDPHICGSYSHVKVGFAKEYGDFISVYGQKVRSLFAPIDDKVFFAGEHAAIDYPATMEGAVTSGQVAAEMVMEKLGR